MNTPDTPIAISPTKVRIDYTNWRGERALRVIVPISLSFGLTWHHPEPQWLLEAMDTEKMETRTFAMQDIHSWTPVPLSEGAQVVQELLINQG